MMRLAADAAAVGQTGSRPTSPAFPARAAHSSSTRSARWTSVSQPPGRSRRRHAATHSSRPRLSPWARRRPGTGESVPDAAGRNGGLLMTWSKLCSAQFGRRGGEIAHHHGRPALLPVGGDVEPGDRRDIGGLLEPDDAAIGHAGEQAHRCRTGTAAGVEHRLSRLPPRRPPPAGPDRWRPGSRAPAVPGGRGRRAARRWSAPTSHS